MRYTVVTILIALACWSGCKTLPTMGEANSTVGTQRTIWIWEKDFWGHK